MHSDEMMFIILEYLKENPYTTREAIIGHVENIVKQRDGVDHITREDALLANDIIWDLLTTRVLNPGIDADRLDLPYLHVSNMDKLNSIMIEDLG